MHLIVVLEVIAQILFIQHALKNNKPRYWIMILLIPWAGFLIYLWYEMLSDQTQPNQKGIAVGPQSATPSTSHHPLAYITQGKLFQKPDALPAEQIHSRFGQKIIDQTIRIH